MDFKLIQVPENQKKLRRKKKKKHKINVNPIKFIVVKKIHKRNTNLVRIKKKCINLKKNRKGRGKPRSYKNPYDAAERTIIDLPEQNSTLNEHINVINNLIDHNEELKNIYIRLRYNNSSTNMINNIRTTIYQITNKIKYCLHVIKNKLTNTDNTYNEEIIKNFETYNKTIYRYIELNYKKDNESLIDQIKTLGNTFTNI